MYFPYLRGRQFELLALRELLENELIGQKIILIIEPLKPTSTLVKTLETFSSKSHLHALVMNPAVGEFVSHVKGKRNKGDSTIDQLYSHLESEYLIKAYIMKKNTPESLKKNSELEKIMVVNPRRDCMEDFLKVYYEFEPAFTLIPDSRSFARKVPNSKIMFMDRFTKAPRNSDYLKNEDEIFSEDHLYYGEEGYKGFSDYSIVGSDFNDSGFAPFAVAIHIVYFDSSKVLRVHHFVSDSNDDINDPAGKFGEAVQKMEKWVVETKTKRTLGINSLLECCSNGKYPGLGTVKKYSIMHHLELMNMFFKGDI